MQLTLALRLVSSWEPFSKLPQSSQARIAESLQALQLRPGQKLYDYNALPPGVALLTKGQMRLLAVILTAIPFKMVMDGGYSHQTVLVTVMALAYGASAIVAVELGEEDEEKVEKVVSEKVIEEHEEAAEVTQECKLVSA